MTASRYAAPIAVASLRRWMARDALSQALAATLDEMTGGDDNTFTIPAQRTVPASARRFR